MVKEYSNPLPLWKTPWYLRIFGYGPWRYYSQNMSWNYISKNEYQRLFGKKDNKNVITSKN